MASSLTSPSTPDWDWQFAGGTGSWTDELLRNWERLEELPGARVLKANLARTVISLPGAGDRPPVIVKRYHVRGWMEVIKYMLQPSRARQEWDALLVLGRQGIAAPRPLGVGEERVGPVLRRAGLIMETVTNAQLIPDWLASQGREARARVMGELGRAVARLHDSGIDHPDLHVGNVLVRESPDQRPRVVVIDHHACRLGAVLPPTRRYSNLAKLFHSLQQSGELRESRAFLRGYVAPPSGAPWSDGDVDTLYRRLLRGAMRLERIRLGSRTRRCWKRTSEFARDRRRGWRVNRRREVDLDGLDPLLDADVALDPILKERSGQRVGVTRIRVSGKELPVVVKIREHRSLLERWMVRLGMRRPLETAWWAGRAMEVRGIPTPRTLALLRRSRGGLPSRSILVTEYLRGAVTLREHLLDRYFPPGARSRVGFSRRVRELAELVRRLHDWGIYHRDLNPFNCLVLGAEGTGKDNGAPGFFLVDLDSVRPRQRLTRRRRCKNLMQLALIPEGHVRPGDRLRFLKAYDRGDDLYWGRDWVEEIDRQLAHETIRIMERISVKERDHALDEEVCDPRFRAGAADLTREERIDGVWRTRARRDASGRDENGRGRPR